MRGNPPEERFDLATKGIEGWSKVDGQWAVEDMAGAPGGIVFRFGDGKYYVVRANALEDNFRLYYHDRGRRQLATARVKAPALGEWHIPLIART